MNEPLRQPPPDLVALDERRIEALTVAMAVAPGVYVRNRMFELFKHPGMQRARTRASLLRGVVRQLGLAADISVECEMRSAEPSFVLRYRIASMRMSRVVDLSRAELSVLKVLGARAGLSCLPPDDEDRARVDAALAHLLDGAAPAPTASPRA